MKVSKDSEYVSALRFNWLTRYYDVIVGSTTRERTFKKALIEQSMIEAGHNVLDLACGTGTLAIWVKQRHPSAFVTGIDGDRNILSMSREKAQKKDVQVEFEQAMSNSLPYPNGHFDRVISSLFFHHLSWENKQRTAKELFRVLKPGAEFHIADWGYPANKLMRGLFYAIQVLDGFENTSDNVRGRLLELFEQAGFSEVKQRKTFSTMFGTMALYSGTKV